MSKSALSINIQSVAVKYSLTPEQLSPWKNKVMQLVDSRIKVLKSKITINQTKPSLHSQDVKAALAELHDKFVIVPIDKASNNIAIVCKRFYIQKLLNEVGVPGDISPTYKLSEKDQDHIIFDNMLLCEKFGRTIEEREKVLPFMY